MDESVKEFYKNIEVLNYWASDVAIKRKDLYIVKKYIVDNLVKFHKMRILVPNYVMTFAMNYLALLDRYYWDLYKDNLLDKLKVFMYSLKYNNDANLSIHIIDLVLKLDIDGWNRKHDPESKVIYLNQR